MIFWDSSAVVSLIFEEPQTAQAKEAWSESREFWAWEWMNVEVEAAIIRRNVSSRGWEIWRKIQPAFNGLSMEASELTTLMALNRGCRLRAADAGHLYVFDRLSTALPETELLTFDMEMARAAEKLALRLHPSCPV